MSSQVVLYLILGIVGFLGFIFMFKRKSGVRAPSRLNLKAQPKSHSAQEKAEVIQINSSTQEVLDQGVKMKSLNVFFVYKGKTVDAYEVLGLPAGSRQPEIERAYTLKKNLFSGENKEILEIAYKILTQGVSQ